MIQEALIEEILANPNEDGPRQICADVLEERNDPLGEFIRLDCHISSQQEEDPYASYHFSRSELNRCLERRARLLTEYGNAWIGQTLGSDKFPSLELTFHRGMVETVLGSIED